MGKNTLDFAEAAHILKVALGGKFTAADVQKLVDNGHLRVVPRPKNATGPDRVATRAVESLSRLGLDNAEFRRRYRLND